MCVAYEAEDLPYVGSSCQFSINLQRLCQDSAGETQQKQGNTLHAASHILQKGHAFFRSCAAVNGGVHENLQKTKQNTQTEMF